MHAVNACKPPYTLNAGGCMSCKCTLKPQTLCCRTCRMRARTHAVICVHACDANEGRPRKSHPCGIVLLLLLPAPRLDGACLAWHAHPCPLPPRPPHHPSPHPSSPCTCPSHQPEPSPRPCGQTYFGCRRLHDKEGEGGGRGLNQTGGPGHVQTGLPYQGWGSCCCLLICPPPRQ